jgi:hypothetical protein
MRALRTKDSWASGKAMSDCNADLWGRRKAMSDCKMEKVARKKARSANTRERWVSTRERWASTKAGVEGPNTSACDRPNIGCDHRVEGIRAACIAECESAVRPVLVQCPVALVCDNQCRWGPFPIRL